MAGNQTVIDNVKGLYSAFSYDAIGRLASIYHPDVAFIDPIHEVQGLVALQQYFLHICEGSNSRFNFTATVLDNNHAFLRWTMHYSHPKLASGKPQVLSGGSFLTIDEASARIIEQEDYYDMGQMIYCHIPVIGWAVKKINRHLAGAHTLSNDGESLTPLDNLHAK